MTLVQLLSVNAFCAEGEGELAGTDNGNPVDRTPMNSPDRKAFNGLPLAVIRSTRKAGTIRLTAISKGLKGAVIDIVSSRPVNDLMTVESLKH